jgi:hypothetical protein
MPMLTTRTKTQSDNLPDLISSEYGPVPMVGMYAENTPIAKLMSDSPNTNRSKTHVNIKSHLTPIASVTMKKGSSMREGR